MATINRNLQLRDIDGNLVFPRASADNIQISKNDGRDATLVVTVNGKIDPSLLPSSVTSVDMLLALSAAAPTGATTGDRYYNVTQNKIYTYTGSSWGSAETPDPGKIYLDKSTNNLYRYDSTSLQMMDILVHFDVTQDVADDPGDASSTNVPSEHAVSVALTKKQDNLTAVAPISIDGASSISLRYGSGLAVEGNSLAVPQSYITGTVDDLMMRDATAASPETAIVDGGTVYSILGNYAVTNTISTTVVEDTRVPTEKAVRDAINAYVATGGSSVTAGKAINVDGGSINVTASTVAEVLGSTIVTGTTVAYEVTPVEQNDLSALTPNNLRSAMSLGQAVDVSCEVVTSVTHVAYGTDGFLGEFTVTWNNSGTNSHFFGFNKSFPKAASGLKYLIIADVKNTGDVDINSLTFTRTGSSQSITQPVGLVTALPNEAKSKTYGAFTRISAVFTDDGNIQVAYSAVSNGTLQVTIKNWRQYEVTALTDDAIAYLASLPDPDLFFRDTNAHNIKNKYLVKQDMVCPFIPTIVMPNDSDLTVGAGLAYKLQITGGTHYISVDTIPENGYGWDAHLQLFVKDTSSVVFKHPLNLLDPLTPNAGQNLTVKFRNGQANVYVDDIDVGYVVSVAGGTEQGSLSYGLTNDVGEYIVFSNALDGEVVEVEGGTYAGNMFHSPTTIVGNGPEKTTIVPTGGTFYQKSSLPMAVYTIENLTFDGGWRNEGTYTYANCILTRSDGNGSILTRSSGGWMYVQNCIVKDTTASSVINVSSNAHLEISGSTITGCTASTGILYLGGTATFPCQLIVTNVVFDATNQGYAIRVSVPKAGSIIQNCQFSSTGKIRINDPVAGTYVLTMDGTNVLDTTVTGSGNLSLASSSVLDLSGNTNTAVVTLGTGTVSVPDGSTASVIPYGGGSPVTISGSGNTLLNTGKLGYLVDVATGTATGTLYDALVGGGSSYSNVIFDSRLDGGNISISGTTVNRNVVLEGNGISGTTVFANGMYMDAYIIQFKNMTIKGSTLGCLSTTACETATDCIFDSCTSQDATMLCIRSDTSHTYPIKNVLFKNCIAVDGDANVRGMLLIRQGGLIENCTFDACDSTNKPLVYMWGTEGTISNCTFKYSVNTSGYCVFITGAGTYSIASCTFKDCGRLYTVNSGMTVKLSGNTFSNANIESRPGDGATILQFKDTNVLDCTVSGGTVVFADGATVKSTLGTGVINTTDGLYAANEDYSVTLDGISITGGYGNPNYNATTSPSARCLIGHGSIKNCSITGYTNAPGISRLFGMYPIVIENSIITSNKYYDTSSGALANAYDIDVEYDTEYIKVKNSTIGNFVFIRGIIDLVNVTCLNRFSGRKSNTTYTPQVRIAAESTFNIPSSVNSDKNLPGLTISVGSYTNPTDLTTWVEGGTATAIINGTTVSIEGHGCTLDTSGLHS